MAQEENDFKVIGQGQIEIEKELLGKKLTTNLVLCSLYNLIEYDEYPSVGGDIQYGNISEHANNFSVYGIVLIKLNESTELNNAAEQLEQEREYCYRGLRPFEGTLLVNPLNSSLFPAGIPWLELKLIK